MFTSNRVMFTACCLVLLASLCLAAAPADKHQPYMAGTVIFKLYGMPSIDAGKSACGQPVVDAALARAGVKNVRRVFPNKAAAADAPGQGLARVCEAAVPLTTDIIELCATLKATGQVVYAEPRYRNDLALAVNDPSYGNQWALPKIQAPAAWDITQGDTTVVIGICDTGVDWDHPDLAANIWVNHGEIAGNGIDDDGNGYIDDIRGWDFGGLHLVDTTDADNNPMEPAAIHGSHVAGCVSEVTNNGTGGAGIGFKCRIMPIKCTPDDSAAVGIYYGYDGIVYAADNGAQIINCSWGGYGAGQYEYDIIQYATGKGSLVVAAAGNGDASGHEILSDTLHHYPSDYDNVLTVAASTSSDTKASFSNYGRVIDVISPGQNIYSTWYNNTYAYLDGTSMASPIAAGTAALVKSVHPGWSPTTIATHLNKTGDNIDALNAAYAGKIGTRINAYKAVTQAALPLVKYQARYISSDNNENGIPEAGESIMMGVSVKNWWGDAASVTGTIASSDYAVNIPSPTAPYGTIIGGATDTASFTFEVDASALSHQAMFTLQTNADGQFRTDTFYVQIEKAPILFVNDGDGMNNVQSYYTGAFNKIGAQYDVFDHVANGTPDSLLLDIYPVVIWSCEWAFPSLNAGDRAALRHYYNHGGKFYVSGQDVGWDLCDTISDPNYAHSYNADPVGCLDFYNNYLHFTYGGDSPGGATFSVAGVANDTLSNGLSSAVFQPGRTAAQQFPDYGTLRAGADTIFTYTGSGSGKISGLRYENGPTKVIYTCFGFEAISDSTARNNFMRRIIKWFIGDLSIAHTPLHDTEDTTNAYRVTAVITSSAGIDSAKLFYNLDGSTPFEQHLAMSRVGATDTFECYIPAQNGKTIQYYFVASNGNAIKSALPATAPVGSFSFFAGPDPLAPAIVHTVLPRTINLSGPYAVTMTATDNYGVFNDSSYIHFRINSGTELPPVQMIGSAGSFSGLITLPAAINTWDTVEYYLTAVDQSGQRNVGRSPAAGYHSFVTTDSVLAGNFDRPSAKAMWDTTGGTQTWRTYATASHSSPASMRTGTGNYANNADYRMTLKSAYSYNLDAYADNGKWVKLCYWQRGRLDTLNKNDTAMVEASKDNINWTMLKFNAKFSSLATFVADTVDLTSFLSGKGANDSISFRFRLKTDGSTANFGWLVDDVYLKVQPITGVAGLPGPALPGSVALSQNRPNPFTARTAISYQLPVEAAVSLRIYNVAGQAVRTLVNGRQPAGYYNLKWDGRDDRSQRLSAGVYLYRLETGNTVITKKLVVVK